MLGLIILFRCISSGCGWWNFAFMLMFDLSVRLISGENCGCLWRQRKHTSHTFVAEREDWRGFFSKLKWERNRLAKKRHGNTEGQRETEGRPQWSMFGNWLSYIYLLYIFTTNLTRWSFKEVKDAYMCWHYSTYLDKCVLVAKCGENNQVWSVLGVS